MVFGKGLLCAALVAGFSMPAMAQMKIESGDIAEGAQMNRAQVRAECRIRGKERGTTHRYIFNVWALDVPELSLSGGVTGAQIRPQLQLHSLGKATLTARYEN